MRKKKVNIAYIVLKIIMIVLIAFFATDAIMQYISYSFYKGDRQLKEVTYEPAEIQFNDSLYGYGYNLDADADKVILFFGGSMYRLLKKKKKQRKNEPANNAGGCGRIV